MPPKKMAMSDRGSGRRRMLMLRIFPSKFNPQERVERCMDAFHELHDGEGPSSSAEEMMRKAELFITEANSILGDYTDEKDGLAQTLSKHPWFVEKGKEVSYDAANNSLSLAARGGANLAAKDEWDTWEEQAWQEWQAEKKEEDEEAAWKKGRRSPSGMIGVGAVKGQKGSWSQPRAQEDRSRSPRAQGLGLDNASGEGMDVIAEDACDSAGSRGSAARWDDSGAAEWDRLASLEGSNLGTISKASAPQPPRTVSKAAGVKGGYAGKDGGLAKVEEEEPEDQETRKFKQALVRCLPEDIRPLRVPKARGPYNLLKACHAARGDKWPTLDLVGGGTVGSSSIADLHELSVNLLNHVKEKALAESVQVEEGTDLTTMFVKENKIGAEAEAALRELPVTSNLRVIGAGSVAGCDPQAVIMARIRRATEAAAAASAEQAAPEPRSLATFVETNWVSTEAERALRLSSAEVQRQAMLAGPLLGQTPSAELLERIDEIQLKVLGAAAAA